MGRWRELENAVQERGLDWGLNHAPADLRYARSNEHARGARLDHLLPAEYRAFVAEVGYPVLGFEYYDRRGISFLPPEAMAYVSADLPDPDEVWPEAVDGGPTVCLYAFFAGTDLSEIDGYAFGPGSGGELVVWQVEDGMPHKECGTFTEWLDSEVTRLAEHAATWSTPEDEDHEEADPHRLLDYSLGGTYDQPPYSAADLELCWVTSDEDSFTYGLVDGTGTWLIPMGQRFYEVQPFRDGVAKVIFESEGASFEGPWVEVRPDGSVVTT